MRADRRPAYVRSISSFWKKGNESSDMEKRRCDLWYDKMSCSHMWSCFSRVASTGCILHGLRVSSAAGPRHAPRVGRT